MLDKDIQQHVEHALDWEPSLDAKDVGVSADAGIVTLRGNVHSYAEKVAAERAALGVYGVKGVANDLFVHLADGRVKTDTELVQAALNTLTWHTMVPEGRVTVTASNGWLTLKGTLDWQFQKDAAARAVRDLPGMRGMSNNIAVQPKVDPGDIRSKIEAAFKRSAQIDARRVNVTAKDGQVILSGNVRSWAERQEAERAAWAAPGVRAVDDRLSIVP